MKIWIAVAAIVAAGGCSGGNGASDAVTTPTALVKLTRATTGAVQATTTVYGAVDAGASARADLVAPAEATVARIVTPIGTRVDIGQVVAILSPSPTTRLELTRATGDAQAATLAYARAQRLRRDGLVADADVEVARAAARSAAATRSSLVERTGAMTLRAPAAGYVEAVAVSPGTLVPAGGAVATVVRSGTTRARFGVTPEIARTVRVGQPIRLTASGGTVTATVASVDPVVDAQTRLASIYATLPPGIPAGASISAQLASGSGQPSVVIPYAALLDDAGQPFVYVVSGGVAHRRNVVVGDEAAGRVGIAAGLRTGEAVVTAGGTAVEDGMMVRTR